MKNYRSIVTIFLIGLVYAYSIFQYKPYRQMYLLTGGDAFGYYVYLPAFFIHHDLADLHTTMTAKFQHSRPGIVDSSFFNKYFMGVAALQAPFFLGAHELAGFLHQPRDGFSMIYMYSVSLSCMVYALLALFLMMLVLRRRFSDSVTCIVLLILGLGTNLYFLVVAQAPFSHVYLLFEYALMLYFTVRFYESFQRRYILLIGLAYGMILLTRLNELYAVLIPIFWGIRTRADVIERVKLFERFIVPVFAAVFIVMVCVLPQLLYWKISTGHYFYYSYQGEKFDFLHPHIINGFFSASNGWITYSPIMLLTLAGIGATAKNRDPSFSAIAVYLPVHIYVIYSWWCWYYMGSYGSRPMVESYALLSIPLAYSVEWFIRTRARFVTLLGILVFCIWLVIFQTYQTSLGIFNSELSNWHFNLATFGKSKLTYEESIVLDTKEFQPHDPVFVKVLGENGFEDPTIKGSDSSLSTQGRRSVCVGQGQVLMGYATTVRDAGAEQGQWLKASVNCLAKVSTDHNWHLSSLVMAFTRKGKMTKWCTVSLQNKIDNPEHHIWNFPVNKWGRVYFYSQLPSGMTPSDTISVYVENIHMGPDIYVDDLKVELYRNK